MAKARKVEIKEEAIATEEIQQDETQQEAPVSDRKLILAPLAKYGVIAIIMVSIIVTTAIMLNKEFNGIDAQVAALDAEIAQRNSELTVSETTETEEVAIIEEATETVSTETEVVAEVVTTETTAAQTTLPEVTLPVATAPAAPFVFAKPAQPVVSDVKSRIAKHHKYLATQDKKQLETFKANQARQIEMLRAQLVKQQDQITVIEMRNQKSYDMRVTAVERMQNARNESLNRI